MEWAGEEMEEIEETPKDKREEGWGIRMSECLRANAAFCFYNLFLCSLQTFIAHFYQKCRGLQCGIYNVGQVQGLLKIQF